MLTHLQIRNFTLITQAEVEFHRGMTVITGETGVGKSILLDALMLCLGERADVRWIRQGEKQCEITATFEIENLAQAQTWLNHHGFAQENEKECVLRRVIQVDGRSRSYINGQITPLQQLSEFSNHLVQAHGQHAQQELLKRDYQRTLLDHFAQHMSLLEKIRHCVAAWQEATQALQRLESQGDNAAKQDLLRYQIQELDALNSTLEEIEALENQQKILSQGQQLSKALQTSISVGKENENGNVLHLLHHMQQQLQPFINMAPALSNGNDLLNQATILVKEALGELENYVQRLDLDPETLERVHQRLEAIHHLARKHRLSMKALPDYHQQLKTELAELENREQPIAQLKERIQTLETEYLTYATQLSQSRAKHALKLSKVVTEKIRALGMPHAYLEIILLPTDDAHPKWHGQESIEFQIAMNPGQPQLPLHKVASGGEISRISLAIYMITAEKQQTPTLIFDEVDTGIGGSTAAIVGKSLRILGNNAQILCVTHAPQVAAQGHHHLKVEKYTEKDQTATEITLLSHEARVAELARMLGGITINAQTIAHAENLLAESTNEMA